MQPSWTGSSSTHSNHGSSSGGTQQADYYSFYRSFVVAAAAKDPELAAALAGLQQQETQDEHTIKAASSAEAKHITAPAAPAGLAGISSKQHSSTQLVACSSFIKPDFTRAQIKSLRKLIPIQAPVVKPAALLQGEYQLLDQLGKGAHGIAYKARHLPSGRLVCIKTVASSGGQQQQQQQQQQELEQRKREVAVLAALDHPNTIRYLDCFCDGSKLHIVMEFMDGGDLQCLLQKQAKAGAHLTEEQLLSYFVQIVLALRHIHAMGIMHRDLKCNNLFLNSDGLLKLGDFGIAKVLDAACGGASTSGSTSGMFSNISSGSTAAALVASSNAGLIAQSFVGTPNFLAPEIIACEPYNQKADIWALGCILHEMATLKPAFKADNIPLIYKLIKRGKTPPLPSRYSPAVRQLQLSLMAKDPNQRPSSAEILLQHAELLEPHLQHYTTRLQQLGIELPAAPQAPAEASTAANSSSGSAGLPGSRLSSGAGNAGSNSSNGMATASSINALTLRAHHQQGPRATLVAAANMRVALWQLQQQDAEAVDAAAQEQRQSQHKVRGRLLHRLKKRLYKTHTTSSSSNNMQSTKRHPQSHNQADKKDAADASSQVLGQGMPGLLQASQLLTPLRHTLSTVLSANSAELDQSAPGTQSPCTPCKEDVGLVSRLSRHPSPSTAGATAASSISAAMTPQAMAPSAATPAAPGAAAVPRAAGNDNVKAVQQSRWSDMLAAAGLGFVEAAQLHAPQRSGPASQHIADTTPDAVSSAAPAEACLVADHATTIPTSKSGASMSPAELLHMQQLAAMYTAQQQLLLPEASGLSTISERSESRTTPMSASFSSAAAASTASKWSPAMHLRGTGTAAAAAGMAFDDNNKVIQIDGHGLPVVICLPPAGTVCPVPDLPCRTAEVTEYMTATCGSDDKETADKEPVSSDAVVIITGAAAAAAVAAAVGHQCSAGIIAQAISATCGAECYGKPSAAEATAEEMAVTAAILSTTAPIVKEQQDMQAGLQLLRSRLGQSVGVTASSLQYPG